jgi:hypothetical protein
MIKGRGPWQRSDVILKKIMKIFGRLYIHTLFPLYKAHKAHFSASM